MITKIWYSIQNAGDGSAYATFMESEKLCEIDQKFCYESWAEECIGCLIIESKDPIAIKNEEIVTVDMVIAEVEEELNEDYMKEYKKQGEYPERFARLEGKLKELKILQSKK